MDQPPISIDLGSALPWLENRILKIFDKDEASRNAAIWFKTLHDTAVVQVSSVFCVGMRVPLAFESIYQPTTLRFRGFEAENSESFAYEDSASRSIRRGRASEERRMGIQRFFDRCDNAIIYAGPGWGKTTFLHHMFRRAVASTDILPVLISLGRLRAVDDLETFVERAGSLQKKQGKARILLLVDGYDEVSVADRKRVSESLLCYHALGVGNYLLSCREYYQVFRLAASEVHIDGFSREDKERFVKAFLTAFNSPLNPAEVVDEFETRGFSDFLSHPLLLALACIVKTSAATAQPRSAIRLLERAIDILCYRWDEQKGIDREANTPLDGKDRISVLKRIAFIAKSRHVEQARAESTARKEIDLLTFDKVDARQVLIETAQFYGILVPTDDGYEFVHRTLHDFLAALYWVESGDFAKVTNYEWDSRTAYAACRLQDATDVLESALKASDGLPAATEILSNWPRFDMKRITNALMNFFSTDNRYFVQGRDEEQVTGGLDVDLVRLASTGFLNHLIENLSQRRGSLADLVVGHCLVELRARRLRTDFVTYDKAIKAFKSERFSFCVLGHESIELGSMDPAKRKTVALKF